MNTDKIKAEWLGGVVAQKVDALVWPSLTYGYYPAFVEYAGSASLSEETFRSVVSDITTGVLRFGARPMLVVNPGVSTLRLLDEILKNQLSDAPVRHLKVHEGQRYPAAAAELFGQPSGSHADELETSRMLALMPDLVMMQRAAASLPGNGDRAGPPKPSGPDSPNFSPSGSWGDPTLARREKGEILLAAMATDVAEMARQAAGASPNGHS